MLDPTAAWLVAAGLAAVIDWVAVSGDRVRLETVAKPAVIVLLMAWVATSGTGTARAWVLLALGLSLVGDVALLPQVDRFVLGLGAFLLGHLAYLPALLPHSRPAVAAPAAVIVALLGAWVGGRIAAGARRRHGTSLAWAVRGYVVAVGITAVLAVSTVIGPVSLGGAAFASSDGVLGWNRFVAPVPHGRLIVHVTYHLAQAGLAAIALA